MAVSIMSARCRASVPFLFLLGCFLQVLIQGEVFRAPQAHNVFLRSKRANLYLVEEILQGNLERECYEELCSYEEARECFEDNEKTIAFWNGYYDGDQCDPNPCLHGGNCTDKVGGFHCSCAAPHYGPVCELEAPADLGDRGLPPSAPQTIAPQITECPTEGPTACHQLCTASKHTFTCSCMPGFKLHTDGRSCQPEVEFPCGRLPDRFNATASMCHHGYCPWQVSLFNSRGVELCSGVVLGRFSVLTAARCLFLDSGSNLRPSNFYVVPGDKKVIVPVQGLFIHNRFHLHHHDHDLALLELASPLRFGPALIHLCLPTKDFSENILMHPGRTGIVERRGVSQTQKLVYMMLDKCRSQLNVSHPLSNKMFCMRRQSGVAENRNRVYRSPNGPSRYQNEAQQMLNGSLGNQNDTRESPNRPLVNQNGTWKNPNQPLGNQNGTRENPNRPLGNQNGTRENTNRPLGNQNGTWENPNRPSGNQNGSQKRLNGHTVNQSQTHDSQSGAPGTPNGAENNDPSKIRKTSGASSSPTSKVRDKQCGSLLPGTPVATVDRGTAFLTGILVSSSAGCDGGGLVFTKLSRYLGWITARLEAFEDHMTTQVSQYPEMH